jgi:hypothetical protein
MLQGIERYFKQSLVDKNPAVASAALVSSVHLMKGSHDVVKRWVNEVTQVGDVNISCSPSSLCIPPLRSSCPVYLCLFCHLRGCLYWFPSIHPSTGTRSLLRVVMDVVVYLTSGWVHCTCTRVSGWWIPHAPPQNYCDGTGNYIVLTSGQCTRIPAGAQLEGGDQPYGTVPRTRGALPHQAEGPACRGKAGTKPDEELVVAITVRLLPPHPVRLQSYGRRCREQQRDV